MSRPETLPQFNKAIIAADETRRGREIITSADWNNLFNQHRYQGNHSETYLEELDHYLFGVIQDGEELSHGVINTLLEDATDTANTLTAHVGNTNNPHGITMSQIPDLVSTLSSKSNAGHTHSIANITNLQTTLNNKVDTVSGKGLSSNDFTDALKTKLESITPTGQLMANWGDIAGSIASQTDLQTALNGKASSSHSHVVSDVTDLQTALSGKASTADLSSVESLLKNMISKYWDSSKTYRAGDYCWYNSKLWKCLTQNSNTTPVGGIYWAEVDVCSELSQLTPMAEAAYNALATKENRLYFLT